MIMEEAVAVRKRVEFQLAHPNAAGIDVGSATHRVALPADRDDQPQQLGFQLQPLPAAQAA